MPKTRHEIELALNSAAYRRVQKAQEEVFGGAFWRQSYREASKELKKHMKEVNKVGDATAEHLSREFDGMFKRAAGNFGDDIQDAAQKGSKGYIKAMKKAVDRIAKIQSDNFEDRAKATQQIIDQELDGLKERIKLEKRASRDSGGGGGGGGKRGGQFKDRAEQLGGALSKGSTKVGGKAGELMGKAGGAIGKLGKFAGMAGVVMGAVAALGVLAKKALEIQREMKALNTQMTQSISATDLMGAGFLDVGEGVKVLRKEFMENIQTNFKWRMSTEEAYEAMNALTASGVTLGKVNRQLGRDVQGVGNTARDIVDTTRTYSTQFKTSVGDIGSFMGDIMLNLGYSFGQARDSLAAIDQGAQRAGISAGVFFGKVQSLNTQLGLMNGSLAAQSDILADIVRSGPLGLEQAATAAASIMGKLDEQNARTVLAWVGEAEAIRIARNELERVEGRLADGGLDPTLRRRLEMERKQIEEALNGGLLEQMHLFEGGLLGEAANLETRMAAVAKVLGKSVDDLNYSDLINVNAENTELLKSLGVMGSSTDEVNTNLAAMAAIIEENGGAAEAIEDMHNKSMAPMANEVAEDIRLAQEMLRETTSIDILLKNITEWLKSKLYDVLVGMYDILVSAFGSDQQKAVHAYDKVLRQIDNEIQDASPQRQERLLQMRQDVAQEQEAVRGYGDTDFQNFVDAYGGGSSFSSGSVDTAVDSRLGTGRDNLAGGAPGGSLTHESGALRAPLSVGGSINPTRGPEARAAAEERVQAAHNMGDLSTTARDSALAALSASGWTLDDVTTDDPMFASWRDQHPLAMKANTPSMAFMYAGDRGLINDTPEAHAAQAAINSYWAALANPMAEGGIVNRPTMALIGEAGPEAVVPLSGGNAPGGFHFHVHGNVYGIDDIKRMMGRAFQEYSRSQRV